MGLEIALLRIKIMLESNPLKSIMLVGGLAVHALIQSLREHPHPHTRPLWDPWAKHVCNEVICSSVVVCQTCRSVVSWGLFNLACFLCWKHKHTWTCLPILAYPFQAPEDTPSSHSKNSLSKICSKGWVAQKPFFDRQFDGGAKIFQGLGPKRRESWIANWVFSRFASRDLGPLVTLLVISSRYISCTYAHY